MLIKLVLSDALAVSVSDAKIRLRLEAEVEEDDLDIEKMIRAATAMVEQQTGRVLLPTEFEYRFDGWSDTFYIPVVPLREVSEMVYLDVAHVQRTVNGDAWYAEGDDAGINVYLDSSFATPGLSSRTKPVRIRFSAGFDDPSDSSNVPDLMPDARDEAMILLLVGHWYANREAASELRLEDVPQSFVALAAQRRIYR